MLNKDKIKIHEKAVEFAACNLIENGITTKNGSAAGIDLVLDNEKTILVRGQSNEISVPLMNGSLDAIKSDFVMIVTNLTYRCIRKVYIMTTEEAKRISENAPIKNGKVDAWWIRTGDYRRYRDNYNIITL